MDYLGLYEFSLRPNGPEIRFWKLLFGMVNEDWLRGLEERTRSGAIFIEWDFIPSVDKHLSKGLQYKQALSVAGESLSSLDSSRCGVLLDTALQVLQTRQMEHSRFPRDPNNRQWLVHEEILTLWSNLVERLKQNARSH